MNPVSCVLCNRSVNLTVDLCCDENGKAVHGDCYFNRIIGSTANLQPVCESEELTLSPMPPRLPREGRMPDNAGLMMISLVR
jgi:hypothetical protein